MLYAPGARACASLAKPVNVIMGLAGAAFSIEQLTALGVRRISLGSALARAALGEFLGAAQEIRERGTLTFAGRAASFQAVERFIAPRAR